MITVERRSGVDTDKILPALVGLSEDALQSGFSLGFLPPFDRNICQDFWRGIMKDVDKRERVLLTASDSDTIVGTVQLALATKQNARHRAEVQKLMVHSRYQRLGIATELMTSIEAVAREIGRTLLVLDTQQASPAESFYPRCGYTRVGVIPEFALGADLSPITTVIFYKLLK